MIVKAGSAAAEKELLQSGGSVATPSAGRMGYLPVPIEHVQISALATIPVYLRTAANTAGPRFTMYCSDKSRFTQQHQNRLQQAGVKFIYVPMSHQTQFREQLEKQLVDMAADPQIAINVKSELIYETSLELMNEILTEEGVGKSVSRLARVSLAISTLVLSDGKAFSHLFAAAQHDFYTATHMVNVGTWMVTLAYAMGIRDNDELTLYGMAGMVHDVGKVYVPEAVLNKKGQLSQEDWNVLRSHPQRGAEHLEKQGISEEIVLRVAREHHERLDGGGYPAGLKGDQIHLASRICAVVDSFDAMTACRPFKSRVMTVAEALQILKVESPRKYDEQVVKTWIGLMRGAAKDGMVNGPVDLPEHTESGGKRAHQRFTIDCAAKVYVMVKANDGWKEGAVVAAKAHSISRAGLGFLSKKPFDPSTYVRIHLQGSGSLSDRVLEGQVVRCQGYMDQWHEVGLKFCNVAGEEAATDAVKDGADTIAAAVATKNQPAESATPAESAAA